MSDIRDLRVVSGVAASGSLLFAGGGTLKIMIVTLEDGSDHVLFSSGYGAGFNLGFEAAAIDTNGGNATLGDVLGKSTDLGAAVVLGGEISIPGDMSHEEALREIWNNGVPENATGGPTIGMSGGVSVLHSDTVYIDSLPGAIARIVSAAEKGFWKFAVPPYLDPLSYFLGFNESCFDANTPISMWPEKHLVNFDHSLAARDLSQCPVLKMGLKKSIKDIEVGDIVVSFNKHGQMVPGTVTRLFQNDAKILLNFHGSRVTPGHVYFRPDSRSADKYETLIDILRDDGVIERQDGTLIRAATFAPVDSPLDGYVNAVTQVRRADGTIEQTDAGRIRLGTRFLVGTGKERKSYAVSDLIKAGGGVVGDDELVCVDDGPGMPFLWEFSDMLPKPEDFVLACSGTTLEDIYKASEWESRAPRLAAPTVLDGGPVRPLKDADKVGLPRNELLTVRHHRPTQKHTT